MSCRPEAEGRRRRVAVSAFICSDSGGGVQELACLENLVDFNPQSSRIAGNRQGPLYTFCIFFSLSLMLQHSYGLELRRENRPRMRCPLPPPAFLLVAACLAPAAAPSFVATAGPLCLATFASRGVWCLTCRCLTKFAPCSSLARRMPGATVVHFGLPCWCFVAQ